MSNGKVKRVKKRSKQQKFNNHNPDDRRMATHKIRIRNVINNNVRVGRLGRICCAVCWTVIFFNGFGYADRRWPVSSAASAFDAHGRGWSADVRSATESTHYAVRTTHHKQVYYIMVLTSQCHTMRDPWLYYIIVEERFLEVIPF